MNPALMICSLPNSLFTKEGRDLYKIIVSRNMMAAPSTKPINGERIIGLMSLGQRPVSHRSAAQPPAGEATAAPHNPPTSAWLELEGRPHHHVSRFQMMALP